jgi:ethanolamine ammonia-lyase small subunit
MSDVRLRQFTPARVGLGRAGLSIPTRELLAFQLAHAQARDAVQTALNTDALQDALKAAGLPSVSVHSRAPDRGTYLQRPDFGRRLDGESLAALSGLPTGVDVVFVVADGLSARAVQEHAPPTMRLIYDWLAPADWISAPIVIARQARVAIGDEIGHVLGAALSVVLIGERPGLSSPDSMGIYLTWMPRPGVTDASRNCISNVRLQGLSYAHATNKLYFLMTAARQRKLSGVTLKEDAASGPSRLLGS